MVFHLLRVQRSSGNVVIGGLFTATILTMVVLPILFKVLMEKNSKSQIKKTAETNFYHLTMLILHLHFHKIQMQN
jgi:cobalt-zinc-cadmium resistance protein CzcA